MKSVLKIKGLTPTKVVEVTVPETENKYSYQEYKAPDGTKASYSFFKKEVFKGHLHGCLACF